MLYGVTVLLMLALQRHHEQRWRDVADVLEELTTTVLRHRADCPLAAIPRIAKQCLAGAGGAGYLAGPAVVTTGEDKSYITLRLNIAYAADPVVAAITSSGHKLPRQFPDSHP